MSSMINFGIDLGTSNSLIARFDRGQVEVLKNPNGFKETLPSVVGFRNDLSLEERETGWLLGRLVLGGNPPEPEYYSAERGHG